MNTMVLTKSQIAIHRPRVCPSGGRVSVQVGDRGAGLSVDAGREAADGTLRLDIAGPVATTLAETPSTSTQNEIPPEENDKPKSVMFSHPPYAAARHQAHLYRNHSYFTIAGTAIGLHGIFTVNDTVVCFQLYQNGLKNGLKQMILSAMPLEKTPAATNQERDMGIA
jgi:hypothetical protein